jgi:subtilisin family serine protease/subtilase family serine protease
MQRQAKAPTVRVITALVAIGLVVGVFFVRTSAQTVPVGPFVAGDVLVKFRSDSNSNAKADAHRMAGGNPFAEISRTGVQRVRVAPGQELAAIARYRRNPNVVYAERNVVRRIPMPLTHDAGSPVVPGDHYFDEQWALHNTGQSFYCIPWPFGGELCFYTGTPDADIDAPEAWAIFKGNSGVTVAVIDSGIDYTHPDVAPNYAGGDDFVFFDGDPMDDHGHGTHVAGTIAAALDNPTVSPAEAEGVAGIAPYGRILAYKVCRADGTCDDFAIQQAIARAIADGANIINMSLGESEFSASLNESVQDAWNAGLVIVAGAGNDGTTNPFYPAALDNVISVAAFDEDHRRASFSNYGSWVDISAPGNVIISTYPMSACGTTTEPGDTGCYTWNSGTSMASPHVAGAAALVWSRNDVTSNSQVVDILLNSADGQGVANVRLDAWTIHGGLNLHDAVSYGLTNLPPLADAGEDQTVADTDYDGGEMVTLDGSASSDRDGSIVSYEWREGSTVVGSGAAPTIWLPSGTHTLTLEVTDEDGDSSMDDVFVSVDIANRVSVTASTAQANEAGPLNGVFTISRTGDTRAALAVRYSVGGTAAAGTDYLALPVEVTIGVGSAAATVTVTPIDDAAYESNESVIVTLLADPAYGLDTATSGTVTIVSDDLPPDLSVSSTSAPSAAGADSDIVVTETTKSQGTGSSPASKTGFYLSSNNTLDATDVWLGDRVVPSLGPGATHAMSTTVHVPPSTATGSYYLLAKADWTGTVNESSETNNVRASGVVKVGPDLVISAMSAPAVAAAGATIDVSETTKNQGGGNAAGSTTRFYWSANTSWDASDQMIGSRTVGPLTAGASVSSTTVVTVPATATVGTYYVIANADGPGTLPETIETNNTRASAGIKVGPDLLVSTVSIPATGAAGGTISATDTTKNQGAGTAGMSSTGFYLSANGSISADDDFIGSRSVSGLAANGTSTGSALLQIPADTQPGSYYVIAQADWNGAIGETSETNNHRSSSLIRIGGDLVVTAVSAPATGMANGPMTVTETTRNQGAAPVPETTTAFFLSSNSTYEPTDQFLGSRVAGALGASASSSTSTQVVIPAGTAPGSYYVVAVADAGNVVAESLENNNTRGSSAVRIGPDFIVTALTAPSSAVAGASISASDTTKNQGGDAAPASVTTFYLSSNASYEPGDLPIGARGVSPLNSGSSGAGSASLVIPSSTAAGTYYIIAKSDGDDSIGEAIESNNTRSRSISVTAAPPP